MAHLGLTPQSIHRLGGFKVQGRGDEARARSSPRRSSSRRPAPSRWCSNACRRDLAARDQRIAEHPDDRHRRRRGVRRPGAGLPRPSRARGAHRAAFRAALRGARARQSREAIDAFADDVRARPLPGRRGELRRSDPAGRRRPRSNSASSTAEAMMEILRTAAELPPRACALAGQAGRDASAFVPDHGRAARRPPGTGATRATSGADRVVASVFVNPTQFGPHEDFARYPRQPEEDAEAARSGRLRSALPARRRHDLPARPRDLRRARRRRRRARRRAAGPDTFAVSRRSSARSFNLVRPDVAVFGEKDAQQLAVVRQVVRDLHFAVEIVGHPTVRESDGLAMSSRNAYLNVEERQRRSGALSRARRRRGLRSKPASATLRDCASECCAIVSDRIAGRARIRRSGRFPIPSARSIE